MITVSVVTKPGRADIGPRAKPMERPKQGIPHAETAVKPVSGRTFRKVFICSPFCPVGITEKDRSKEMEDNLTLAKKACRYAVEKSYVPLAPHLYFPQFLNDAENSERRLGIFLGLYGLAECAELWVIGRRISEGMKQEIGWAQEWGIPVRYFVPELTGEERILKAILGADFPYEEMV